jgi:hypothetical protein
MRAVKGCLLTIIIGIANLLIGGYILDSMFGDFQFPTIKGYLYKELTKKPKKPNSGKTKSQKSKSAKRKNSTKSKSVTPKQDTTTSAIKQDTTIVVRDTILRQSHELLPPVKKAYY